MIDGLRRDLISSTGFKLGVNYGWNRVRFPAPVPAGSRIRASAEVTELEDVGGGRQVVTRFTVDVEGSKAGRVADWSAEPSPNSYFPTVSVPSMPPSRCPGTSQKKV